MKRRFQGLASMSQPDGEVQDGVYLVRVDQVRYAPERQKPFYLVRFSVIEPAALAGRALAARLYCTPRALWKFSWFLRDFGYDAELFRREEIEDKALIGLSGVVKVSHVVINGRSLLNLEAFAPAAAWAGIGPQSVRVKDTEEKAAYLQLHPTRTIPCLSVALPISLPGRLARERNPSRAAVRACF